MQVLALDLSGRPYAWLSAEQAVTHYAKHKVAWELGALRLVFHGGHNRSGIRSQISIAPIIAVAGSEIMARQAWLPLTLSDHDNEALFARDRNTCAYCGQVFPRRSLTRDHILARSRGGLDSWMNCVTACRRCNNAKGNRLVSDFAPLVYIPYIPCRFEHYLLTGRHILADQHDYLAAQLPQHSRMRGN